MLKSVIKVGCINVLAGIIAIILYYVYVGIHTPILARSPEMLQDAIRSGAWVASTAGVIQGLRCFFNKINRHIGI